MNWLGKVLLIVVLASLIAIPVSAGPPNAETWRYESVYVQTDDSWVEVYFDDSPWGNYSSLRIYTPTFHCELSPLPIDVPNIKGASPVKLNFSISGDGCYFYGAPLSEVVVDLTMEPLIATHRNSNGNVIVGDYQSEKCQNWYKQGSGNEISGSIGGVPVTTGYYSYWGASQSECTYK